MERMGDAWDVAYTALFLARSEAKYVTGAEGIQLLYGKFPKLASPRTRRKWRRSCLAFDPPFTPPS
jgi:hypothetical protein